MINLSTVNSDNSTATEDIKCEYSGDEIDGFNSRYVMDIINNLESDNITLKFNGNIPIIVEENQILT